VANTFGIPMFKTESIDDLNFEKFKVLMALTEEIYSGNGNVQTSQTPGSGSVQSNIKRGKTVRITNG